MKSRYLSTRTRFTRLYQADCLEWLSRQRANRFHGVVTDPPYGMIEYSEENLAKMKAGHGGVWRIPPSIGGSIRQPLPRFTVLKEDDIEAMYHFFYEWAGKLKRVLVPGAHVLIASSPLLSDVVASGIRDAGYEKRGEVVRLVRTLRGGDRPKGAEDEFPGVNAMPRSSWEPWLLFRKPFEGTLAENLRRWKAGGLRRVSDEKPLSDVILSTRTPKAEKLIAPHPSLKPQDLLRQIVYAMLPLGEGILLDTFAGSGSTLAAAEALGYRCIGTEKYPEYFEMARTAIPRLAELPIGLQRQLLMPELVDSVAD